MEAVQKEQERLEKQSNLKKSVDDIQKTIDLLVNARNSIAGDPNSVAATLAKLQNPVKDSLDKVNDDLKEIYSGLNRYGKALDKKFKDKPLPSQEHDALSGHPSLINRAIAMHLLREGQFNVASTFIEEANANPLPPSSSPDLSRRNSNSSEAAAWESDFANGARRSESLQRQFAEMYHILSEMRHRQHVTPAIEWARKHSNQLEARGSNLEFELCRLQFVMLFTSSASGPLLAWQYAKSDLGIFQPRYAREIQQLLGAFAFYQNLSSSPYAHLFQFTTVWDEVSASFTREFCSLLGLSSSSPLYTAATAGAIALPTLLKLQQIMKEKRTEWTSQNELPVEIPLPPAYHFHSIFVCPVSKEQGTDENPPMMMPCGHVIAKESLERVSKGARFKCPYCPGESHPRDAKKVFL